MAAVRLLRPITAEVCQIPINLCQCDFSDKGDVHVHNGDLVPWLFTQAAVTGLFQIAKEIAKIQKILVNSFLGMSFDRLMVSQEIAENLRRLIPIIHHRMYDTLIRYIKELSELQIISQNAAAATWRTTAALSAAERDF